MDKHKINKKQEEPIEEAEIVTPHKAKTTKPIRSEEKKPGLGKKLKLGTHITLSTTERFISGLSSIYEKIFVSPKDHKVVFQKEQGIKYFDAQDYEKALDCLIPYIQCGNDVDADILFLIAMAYVNLEQHKDAMEYFKKAEKIMPDDPDIITESASCLIALEDYTGASTYLEKAIARGMDDADNYYYLGNCYEKINKLDEAKKMYKKAIDLNPREALYYQSLGFVYESAGNHNEAIICLRKAMELERKQKTSGGGAMNKRELKNKPEY